MQHRSLPVPAALGDHKCPNTINEYISAKRFSLAADTLINNNIPFNKAFLFLSNSPEATSIYLKKMVNIYENEPKRKAIVVNLYISIGVPMILTLPEQERAQAIKDMADFFQDQKSMINKTNTYDVIKKCSLDELLLQAYRIFNSTVNYIDILFERQMYNEIVAVIDTVDEDSRSQIYRRFPCAYLLKLIKRWARKGRPQIQIIVPMLTDLIFEKIREEEYGQAIVRLLEKYRSKGELETSSQVHLLYFALILTSDQTLLGQLYKDPAFEKMLVDFLIRWLARDKRYSLAGQLCAQLPDRHLLAVSFCKRDSLYATLDLLTSSLKEADDIRKCWLKAIERKPDMDKKEESEWRTLLNTAIKNGALTLDDLFPLMPEDMPISTYQDTILRSITDYQEHYQASQNKIEKFIDRASEQRTKIEKGSNLNLNIDASCSCNICSNSIYREKFLVFPCSHTIHVRCLLSNMHLYYDSTEQLNLISLAARAARNEKNLPLLGDSIGRSCPVCGELSVSVLDKEFVITEETEERNKWSLP